MTMHHKIRFMTGVLETVVSPHHLSEWNAPESSTQTEPEADMNPVRAAAQSSYYFVFVVENIVTMLSGRCATFIESHRTQYPQCSGIDPIW